MPLVTVELLGNGTKYLDLGRERILRLLQRGLDEAQERLPVFVGEFVHGPRKALILKLA